MIPAKRKEFDVTSTIEGEEIGMTIDENSLQHIMSVLTELYSDDEMAIVREYSANALDSHIAAGNKAPIEVTTPTTLAPFLRIKDYGVGLNAADIKLIYSKYGLSTKTHTNEQTGVLGLGCKSALAYTNQFTLTGVKNGVRVTVSVSRDEEGIGTMTIVDQEATDEPNGVEVVIPAKANNEIKDRAEKLFSFWPADSVLLDGEQPERIDGLQINESILLVKRRFDAYSSVAKERLGNSYIIMGNVPYPINDSHFDFGLSKEYIIIATVPNGSLHFHPSREELRYTPLTKRILKELDESFRQSLADAITREIENAQDKPEALRVAIRWQTALPRALRDQVFKYRGIELPSQIKPKKEEDFFLVSYGQRETDYYGKPFRVGKHSRYPSIDLTMVPDAIWVYGFDRTFTPNVKKKLWEWCDQNGMAHPENFIMCVDKPRTPWIATDCLIPWEKVDAIKLPRHSRFTGSKLHTRITGSYDLFQGSTFVENIPGEQIDTSHPLYIHMGNKDEAWPYVKILSHCEDQFSVVLLNTNRKAKFMRLFPDARPARVVAQEYCDIWWETLTEHERELLSWWANYSSTHYLTELPQVGLADPELTKAVRMIRYNGSHRKHLSGMLEAFGPLGNQKLATPPNPLTKYPLYQPRHYYYGHDARLMHKHGIIYLNAVYQSQEH